MNQAFRKQMCRAARVECRSAGLDTEFGMNLFRIKFADRADKILSELGVYASGKRKGQPRGVLQWIKVTEGGWFGGHAWLEIPPGVRRPGSQCYMVTLNNRVIAK